MEPIGNCLGLPLAGLSGKGWPPLKSTWVVVVVVVAYLGCGVSRRKRHTLREDSHTFRIYLVLSWGVEFRIRFRGFVAVFDLVDVRRISVSGAFRFPPFPRRLLVRARGLFFVF